MLRIAVRPVPSLSWIPTIRSIALIVAIASVIAGCADAPNPEPSSSQGSLATEDPTGSSSPAASEPRIGGLRDFTRVIPGKDKTEADAAAAVVSARLRSLGIDDFTIAMGDEMTVSVPFTASLGERTVIEVMARRGAISFVPMRAADGGATRGGIAPNIKPLDAESAPVIAATPTIEDGVPALELTLAPRAAASVAAYSRDHVGDYLVVVMDGRVVLSPMLLGEIPDGRITLTFGPDELPPVPFDVLAAIMASGPLPEGWD